MNEKEEKTVKPKSDVAYDYYKTRFEAENEIKEGFYQKTNFLIIAMSLVASFALYFLSTYFVWDWNNFLESITFLMVIGGVLGFIVSFVYLFLMTYDCAVQPMADAKNVRENEKALTPDEFEEMLKDRLAECVAVNKKQNGKRSAYFYKSQLSLLFSFAFFAVFAVFAILR